MDRMRAPLGSAAALFVAPPTPWQGLTTAAGPAAAGRGGSAVGGGSRAPFSSLPRRKRPAFAVAEETAAGAAAGAAAATSAKSTPQKAEATLSFMSPWRDLRVPAEEMRPDLTLAMGQSFKWQQLGSSTWVGVLGGHVLALRQCPTTTLYAKLRRRGGDVGRAPLKRPRVSAEEEDEGEDGVEEEEDEEEEEREIEALLRDYLQLDESLAELYPKWAAADERMRDVALALPGVRVLRQDPFECLLSFICSSNNNLSRITLMLDNLRRTYGRHLLTLTVEEARALATHPPVAVGGTGALSEAGAVMAASPSSSAAVGDAAEEGGDTKKGARGTKMKTKKNKKKGGGGGEEEKGTEDGLPVLPVHVYAFPTPAELSTATEQELRDMGFGYRAPYIRDTMRTLRQNVQEGRRVVAEDDAAAAAAAEVAVGNTAAGAGGGGGIFDERDWLLELRRLGWRGGGAATATAAAAAGAATATAAAAAPGGGGGGGGSHASSIHDDASPQQRPTEDSQDMAHMEESQMARMQKVSEELQRFAGVGPKVADCVALFSLDQAACIPVDVHVWRIACRDFVSVDGGGMAVDGDGDGQVQLKGKSLTPRIYRQVGDLFRRRYGARAGWAHSLLFAAELSSMRSRLSPALVQAMDDFKQQEKEEKEAKKKEKADGKGKQSKRRAKEKREGEGDKQ